MGDHLKGLGSTRSCHQTNHLLQTPDTFVRAPLPGMLNATAIVHAAPAMGAQFVEYSVEMAPGGTLAANGSQRFVYVSQGSIDVDCSGEHKSLEPGGYCYIPPDVDHQITSHEATVAFVIEKPYDVMPDVETPAFFGGSSSEIDAVPLMGDANVRVQMLIPELAQFDFAVNIMNFDPGASLSMVEIHFMEHGLMQLQGGGIYKLGDCWHPITAGDFIWMAPYCPQWFGALGKEPARYLIYKDWNRAPAVYL
jgi:(S)-ureidoglycine aminohydrolase